MAEMVKKATRESFGEALCALAETNPDIVVLDADLAAVSYTHLVFHRGFHYLGNGVGVLHSHDVGAVGHGFPGGGVLEVCLLYTSRMHRAISKGEAWMTAPTMTKIRTASQKLVRRLSWMA